MHNTDLKTHLFPQGWENYLIHYGTWILLSGMLRNTTSLHIIRTCQGKSLMSASEPPTMCWSTETARATGSKKSRNILSVVEHWSKKWCLLALLHTLYIMLRECLISLYTVCDMSKSATSASAGFHRRVIGVDACFFYLSDMTMHALYCTISPMFGSTHQTTVPMTRQCVWRLR